MDHMLKKIIKLSWPVMLAVILQNLMGTADLYFISKISNTAAAAANLGVSLYGVIFVSSALISVGTMAIVARYVGEGNQEMMEKTTGTATVMAAVIGLFMGILCLWQAENLLNVIYRPEASLMPMILQYVQVIFIGMPVIFVNSTWRQALQSNGDTMSPLIIFGIANIVNIGLDAYFILVLNMGLQGAALATVLSQTLALLGCFYMARKEIYLGKTRRFIKSLKFEFSIAKRIASVGGWAALQQLARPFTGMLMFSMVYSVSGVIGTAAFGYGGQLFSYTFVFLGGLSMALSILVGQAMGRGDVDEIPLLVKKVLLFSAFNMLIFAIPYFIFPQAVIMIFTKDPEVVAIGVNYLRIVYSGLITVMFTMSYAGVFNGAGDTKPPMIASLVANVVVKLPLAFVLSTQTPLGVNGVWIAVAVSVIVEAVIIGYYYKLGKWKHKKI